MAIVELLGTLLEGDQIRITGSTEFEQEVSSIQIEHEQVKEAEKGQVIGLKVEQPVKKGDEVYKIG